jgi:hypothetical protein
MKKLSLILIIPLLFGAVLIGCGPVDEDLPPEEPIEQVE